jgi:DNA-binding NarL/FixJ family response regulator
MSGSRFWERPTRHAGNDADRADSLLLTPREREVIAFVREGATTVEIGRRLHIPERAAAAILREAVRKLAPGAPSR